MINTVIKTLKSHLHNSIHISGFVASPQQLVRAGRPHREPLVPGAVVVMDRLVLNVAFVDSVAKTSPRSNG
jgi:hypothetical protein